VVYTFFNAPFYQTLAGCISTTHKFFRSGSAGGPAGEIKERAALAADGFLWDGNVRPEEHRLRLQD
jgi:hypothetical protein